MAPRCPAWVTLCPQRCSVPKAFPPHGENFHSETVVCWGCVKDTQLNISLLIFDLKCKPLFTDFHLHVGASFLLRGEI